ncbi:hypothetical protein [Streptomyces incanus]|uniref:Uncharacterized protein n=1 Tax=Streptomyces incanus TaxID=887453 RepID=A0ABW0XK85_9ACTN
MESYPSLRLLPWSSPDGKPCFLADGGEGGYVSRLADGLDVLRRARLVLEDPMSPYVEVRYAGVRLTECLADALRVAEARGRRLPSPDDTDEPCGAGDSHGTDAHAPGAPA